MVDAHILLPLMFILLGAGGASLFAIPAVNRRVTPGRMGFLLAFVPLGAFVWLVGYIPLLRKGGAIVWQQPWMPSSGLSASLYFDSLGALFAYLITFIGALILIYAGQYFKEDRTAWRFMILLLLFMAAMLGLVMAGDVLTLFIFWEATSILSYLLVAYKTESETARKSAFQALAVTGGGGIALLVGLLLIAHVTGSTQFSDILTAGERLRASHLYPVMLALVALGAMTKSAQFPFHFWLPGAMSAPTPASAFLHSATMVKAGVYLLARLNPALGQTEPWFWLLTLIGMVTMVTGVWLGLKQNDIKAMLAYSTISQLGVLVMMIGQDTAIAFKALVIGILAHALYKSALFMTAGILDHETGTRDLRRLGGLRRRMPVTYIIALTAAGSMAGLPPLFGFLAKETLLATAVHPSMPAFLSWILPLSTVVAGALMLAIAGRFIADAFWGRPRDNAIHSHEAPPLMLLAPALPTLLSVVIGLLPEPKEEAVFLANAAAAAFGDKVKVSTAMWTGLNVPMLLSIIAVSSGTLLWLLRNRFIAFQERTALPISGAALFLGFLNLLDRAADVATRLQSGRLRSYLIIMFLTAITLVMAFGGFSIDIRWQDITWPAFSFSGEMVLLRILAIWMVVGAALACILLKRDLDAILAFGVSGLGVAVLMALEPAPDLALVQIVVDILTVVVLLLALSRLPKEKAPAADKRRHRKRRVMDLGVSAAFGLIVMSMALSALVSRPRFSVLTPFFERSAKTLAGSKSVVGAVLVEFRALDTLMEIAVFGIAGLGIYTLLVHAAGKHGDTPPPHEGVPFFPSLGIGGWPTSPFVRGLARLALPMAMVIGLSHILFGHDRPGDGFTAGVIISIGIGFWYAAFGYQDTRNRLPWIKPTMSIGTGILLATLSGLIGLFANGHLFSHADLGKRFGLPLPKGIHLGNALLFEVAICLSVIGSVSHMLNRMGHPPDDSPNSPPVNPIAPEKPWNS